MPFYTQIELYNHYKDFQQCKIIVMGGGTYHKPPILNDSNYVIHESSSCALYLTQQGDVDPKDIYREWSSYDTIANGYYAYLNYIKPLNIKEFVLITSKFHMPRVKVIFDYFNDIFFIHNYKFILLKRKIMVFTKMYYKNVVKEKIIVK